MMKSHWLARTWLSIGYLFLYLPILVLIVYSFNDSSQDMAWHGFTFKWYEALKEDQEIITGFLLSLKIAALSASCSVVLGVIAAYVLTHYPTFKGRRLFEGMLRSPLVTPEVVIGLSLLLMLIALENAFGFPERGLFTLIFGHTILGTAYAAVVIEARLQEIDPTLSEAAMDLGCRPYQVFGLITLPNISQALASAWLLTFTLSLDDVVISSFLTGPGYSTMPIVIFSRARLGLDPRVNVIAALTIFIVSLAVMLTALRMGKKTRYQS